MCCNFHVAFVSAFGFVYFVLFFSFWDWQLALIILTSAWPNVFERSIVEFTFKVNECTWIVF